LQSNWKSGKIIKMGRKSSKFSKKNNARQADPQPEALNRRVEELTSLLEASRRLSHILDLKELYAAIADIVCKELGLQTLAIFAYNSKFERFSLVYTQGLGESNLSFKKEHDDVFWRKILQKEPFWVRDPSGKQLFSELFEVQGLDKLQSILWAPVIMAEEVTDILALGPKMNGQPFDDADCFFLKQIAAHAAVCINTCHLYLKRKQEKEELNKTLYNLSILYSISRALTYISDLKSLLKYILNQAIEITFAEKGSIMLHDQDTNLLTIRVLAGLKDKIYQEKVNNSEIRCKTFKPGEGIAGRVFQTGVPMVANKAGEEELFVDPDSSFVRSIVCIPMMVYSDVLGVINVTNKKGDKGFSQEDVEMLKAVADQAAVAINKAQLWEMAVTDSLTGLYVRRYFLAKFQDEIHRAERYGKILSIVMADLDRFKRVNDTYGHTAGDRVLEAVGKFLEKNIRDVDVIARFGGEEFVILLPEADKYEAYTVSERLRQKFSKIKFDNLPPLTISLGIASYPEDGKDLEMLIKRADAAMYAAKLNGRNKVIKYTQDMEQKIAMDMAPTVSQDIVDN
jgi:diguanylate cyclase (GGDEF)-like protein